MQKIGLGIATWPYKCEYKSNWSTATVFLQVGQDCATTARATSVENKRTAHQLDWEQSAEHAHEPTGEPLLCWNRAMLEQERKKSIMRCVEMTRSCRSWLDL